jgi:hypothetical protein
MPRIPNDLVEQRRAEQLAKGPTMVIILNGKSKFFNGTRISYEDIVGIVCEHVGNPEALHTVAYSYRSRRSELKPGTLAPGQDAPVERGMVINAVVTDNG